MVGCKNIVLRIRRKKMIALKGQNTHLYGNFHMLELEELVILFHYTELALANEYLSEVQ